jgi:hypothetical protein
MPNHYNSIGPLYLKYVSDNNTGLNLILPVCRAKACVLKHVAALKPKRRRTEDICVCLFVISNATFVPVTMYLFIRCLYRPTFHVAVFYA